MKRRTLALGVGLALLAGCSGSPAGSSAPTGSATDAATTVPSDTEASDVTEPDASTVADDATTPSDHYPVTVELDSQPVTIESAPQKIAALSSETGDIALALVDSARFVVVHYGSQAEGTGTMVEAAKQVESVLPPGGMPEAEQVLTYGPDLVLMTARHAEEKTTAEVLATSGVPTLSFADADFASPEAVMKTITLMGEALGEQHKAAHLVEHIQGELDAVAETVAKATTSPRVLVLMARGDQVMIVSQHSMFNHLVEMAGGTAISSELGLNAATPLNVEQIVATQPDIILVENFRNLGLTPFEAVLQHDAVAQVPAIVAGNVHAVDPALASATATINVGHGLEAVAALIHPDLFPVTD